MPCIQECITKRIDEGRHHEDLIGSLMIDCVANNYTPDEIAGMVLTMFTAGTLTSISLVAWIIKYLHDYPHAREFIQVTMHANLAFWKCLLEYDN